MCVKVLAGFNWKYCFVILICVVAAWHPYTTIGNPRAVIESWSHDGSRFKPGDLQTKQHGNYSGL